MLWLDVGEVLLPRKPLTSEQPQSSVTTSSSGEKFSTEADMQEIFLPVSGFINLYPEEIAILDHPALQRLGKIYQLGHAYVSFRGATHKRLEHVIGAVHVAHLITEAINKNAEKALRRHAQGKPVDVHSAPLSVQEIRFVRLGALLHDVGHVAAGHTLEDELALIDKHDEDTRITKIFEKNDWNEAEKSPTLESLINDCYSVYVPNQLREMGVTAAHIARLLIRKPPPDNSGAPPDGYATQQKQLSESSEIRFDACWNMIGNTICADLLDYLHRDWHHIGKLRDFDDRIFQYMQMRPSPDRLHSEAAECWKKPAKCDRFVIALGRGAQVRSDGVSAILSLLEWRYELAETALYHRTKVSAAAMLDRALFELWGHQNAKDVKAKIVDDILTLSDEQMIEKALADAEKGSADGPVEAAANALKRLIHRKIYKEIVVIDASDGETALNALKSQYSPHSPEPAVAAGNRNRVARMLERDFGLGAGSLAVYFLEVKPKIAEVLVAVDGVVSKFQNYEAEHGNRLSGGHLTAQIARFNRLKRMHFFMDRGSYESLKKDNHKKLNLMKDFIKSVVLANADASDLQSRARTYAVALEELRCASTDNTRRVVSEGRAAAHRDDTITTSYPNGAPALFSFFGGAIDLKPSQQPGLPLGTNPN